MKNYLTQQFDINSTSFANCYDELPLWSAKFGLLLLENIKYKPNITVLDVGFGTGFPLFEIAERLGSTSKIYGIDLWKTAIERAEQKKKLYNIPNVELVCNDIIGANFNNNFFDLIVSNLGINNFPNPEEVLRECNRVLKENGTLLITTNFSGHMKEFYTVFEETLEESNLKNSLNSLHKHQESRTTPEKIEKLYKEAGFSVTNIIETEFKWQFANGTALLNHHFIRLAFLDSWKEIISQNELNVFFNILENNLNEYANKNNGIELTIPYGLIEGKKCVTKHFS